MLFRLIFAGLLFLGVSISPASSLEFHNAQLETQVEALFQGDRDFAEIKLLIDCMVAPGVVRNADETRKGQFRGQAMDENNPALPGDVNFYRKGDDVVVTKPDGTFVTIMSGGINNPSFTRATSY